MRLPASIHPNAIRYTRKYRRRLLSSAGDPSLTVELRVIQPGKESTIVSYGFKGSALEDIRNLALEYRSAVTLKKDVEQIQMRQELLGCHLAQDSFHDYLQHACPADPAPEGAEACHTHPQYFIWPSDRFFMHYRPQ